MPQFAAPLIAAVMHFSKETQERERKVTEALAAPGFLQLDLMRELGIDSPALLAREFDKENYGRRGDVDLVLATGWGTAQESLYAVEVKVMVLGEDGEFRSEKLSKHDKQLALLKDESWHYIYLLDVIVTRPVNSWFHPQAFDGFDAFRKNVDDQSIGHTVVQINAVEHKPETEAGSASFHRIRSAERNTGGHSLGGIRASLSKVWPLA